MSWVIDSAKKFVDGFTVENRLKQRKAKLEKKLKIIKLEQEIYALEKQINDGSKGES